MGAAISSEADGADELQQEPEAAPCQQSSSPLSPQLSLRGTAIFGPLMRVSDPYNILSPGSSTPRVHSSSRLQSMSNAASPHQTLSPSAFRLPSPTGQNVCTEIHFIRHAESTLNAKPELIGGRSPASPLTALGKRQARALGVHLRSSGMDFDAVYSSPLERAKQTAYIVCQELDIPRETVEMVEAVQELSQGQWEGRMRSDIYTPAMVQTVNSSQPDFRAPGGESQRQVEFRMIEFLNNVVLPRASMALQKARAEQQRGSRDHLNKMQHASTQVHPLEDADVSKAKDWEDSDLHPDDHSKALVRRELEQGLLQRERETPESMGGTSESGISEEIFSDTLSIPYTVAVVSHSLAIKCLLRALTGSNPQFTTRWCVDNTSVTVVRHSTKKGWEIQRVNDTSHLRLL